MSHPMTVQLCQNVFKRLVVALPWERLNSVEQPYPYSSLIARLGIR